MLAIYRPDAIVHELPRHPLMETNKVLELGTASKREQIILSVEPSVKKLIDNIAHKGQSYTKTTKSGEVEVEFEQYENYPEAPSSLTGVVVHYVLKGIADDMGITFDELPYAVRERNTGSSSSRGPVLTKEAKNDILRRCDASTYGDMEWEEIAKEIGNAMNMKKYWEAQGYVLIPEKGKPPMKKDSEKYMDYLAAKEKAKAAAQARGNALGAQAKARSQGA